MTNTRRVDDPPTFHGPDVRADESTFKLRYKEADLSVRGISVFVALALATTIGSNFYAGYLVKEAVVAAIKISSKEHEHIRASLDRTSCQVNLTPDERARFRESYAPGAFKRWCPWVDE